MSYLIGDESDDESGLQSFKTRASRPSGKESYLASTAVARQPHQFADPFGDESNVDGRTGNITYANGEETSNQSLIYDDYAGGQSANPFGTATEVKRGPGLHAPKSGGSYNRYDVYGECVSHPKCSVFGTSNVFLAFLVKRTSYSIVQKKPFSSMFKGDNGDVSATLPYRGRATFEESSDSLQPAKSGRQPVSSLQGSQGFLDEDDEEQIKERNGRGRAGSRANGKIQGKRSGLTKYLLDAVGVGKPRELGGERIIYINDQAMNSQFHFCNNYISTGKYNLVTFVPKFLSGEHDGLKMR